MNLSIFAAAAEAGEHLALLLEDHRATFAELASGARAALQAFADAGITGPAAAPLAVVAGTERATFERVLAAFAVGIPVLLLHPRAPAAERARLTELAGARLPPPAAPAADADNYVAAGALPPSSSAESAALAPALPLVIVATSGSTGAPKGVVLSRGAILASARASAANLGWESDDRWLLALPLAHVGGLSVLTRCLLARRPVVVAPRGDPATIAAAVERHRVTLLSLVPTQLGRLLAAAWQPPPWVRAILVGGAPAAPAMLATAAARGWPLLTTYGLTEAASQVTCQHYGTRPRGDGGAGLPLPGTEVSIRDGRVAVRGPTLASGYLDGAGSDWPGLRFRPLPLDPEGWFLTEDRGHLDDSRQLHVAGRADHVIVTGGEKVAPERVEAELGALPEIVDAAIGGRPDADWGTVVVACVVWAGAPLTLTELRARLAPRLAPHELPRVVCTVVELPRLPSGKLDRRALAVVAAAAD